MKMTYWRARRLGAYARTHFYQYFALITVVLGLLLMIGIVSSSVRHRLPLVSTQPYVLTLNGTVLRANDHGGLEGVGNADVFAGGYRTTTMSTGRFRTRLISRSLDRIPVVIDTGRQREVFFISYAPASYTLDQRFVVRD